MTTTDKTATVDNPQLDKALEELHEIEDQNAINPDDPDPDMDDLAEDEDGMVAAPTCPQDFRTTQGTDFLR